jgi:hypothetical protein
MVASPAGTDPPAGANGTGLPGNGSPAGIYRPRRPQSSPLYRLLQDHFEALAGIYEERFEHRYGPWRPVVREVVEKFLDCGLLEPGFARVRCEECGAEFLLAFSCKCRYFCPSCHAKRLAIWCDWLESELLLPIPHRQYVFSIPKRLRPYFLYDRRLLGMLSRVAYETLRDFMHSTLGEDDVVPGAISSIQTHGTLANWHPHLHVLVTDGAFRPGGTFVPLGAHSIEILTEAFRRAMLRAFVRHGLFTEEVAASMLAWPHSGFHLHNEVRLQGDDRRGVLQLARYSARAPIALARITYDADQQQVLVTSDKSDGPTAGTHAFDPLDFLAQLTTHIPRKGTHMVRYYGAYSSRRRAEWRRQGVGPWMEQSPEEQAGGGNGAGGTAGQPPDVALDPDVVPPTVPDHDRGQQPSEPPPQPPSPTRAALRKRWAELLRRIFEVHPLACPHCGGEMRIIAFILEPTVIDAILRHLRRRAYDARAGPWAGATQDAEQQVGAGVSGRA